MSYKGKGKGKGKEIAHEWSPGKRKRKDSGGSYDARKRKNSGVLQFFDDVADIGDDALDSDDSFSNDDFMGGSEQMTKGSKVSHEPCKAQNLPFHPKEEELSGEELEKMLGERYKDGSGFIKYADDEYDEYGSFFNDGFMGGSEQMTRGSKDSYEPSKAQNLPFHPKEAVLSVDELERMFEERYKDGFGFVKYADDSFHPKEEEPSGEELEKYKDGYGFVKYADDPFLTIEEELGEELERVLEERYKNASGFVKYADDPFLPKEEELSGKELERVLEERYKDGSGFVKYAGDDYDSKRFIGRNYAMPMAGDPAVWKVECTVGRERQSSFCLMQKYVDLESLGTKLNIISAFSVENVMGVIYVEADKKSDVNEACKGISSLYISQVVPVQKSEVPHLLSVRSKNAVEFP